MSSYYEFTIRLPVPPSHIQLSSNGVYFALPYTKTTIGIWNIQSVSSTPVELEGHRRTVSAFCFSHNSPPTLLCSGALDYIIVWNLEEAKKCHEKGEQIRGTIIATTPGEVQYLSFSTDDTMVAACVDKSVIVLNSKKEKKVAVLEGHTSQINCAEFCPHLSTILVTAGADRTFKVWNISSQTLVYQSAIVSSSPFLSLAMDPEKPQVAIGSADGQVRIYELAEGKACRCLHHLNLMKVKQKITNSRQELEKESRVPSGPVRISSHRGGKDQGSYADELNDNVELGASVYSMLYTTSKASSASAPLSNTNLPFLNKENTLLKEVLDFGSVLVVATTSCLMHIDVNTMEPKALLDFQESMPSASAISESAKVISSAGNAVLAKSPTDNLISCIVGSCFQNEVHLLKILEPSEDSMSLLIKQLNMKPDINEDGQLELDSETSPPLSVLSTTPLCEYSPLRAELVLKEKSDKSSKRDTSPIKGVAGQLNKKGKIVDNKPLTFHNAVKSSGYSIQEPRPKLFQSQSREKAYIVPEKSRSLLSLTKSKEYPMDSPPPKELRSKLNVADRPTAINYLQCASDGTYCACALADSSVQVFKMSFTGKGSAYTGHDGMVSYVSWSHDNKWLLSSSNDKTAAVWTLDGDTSMTMKTMNNNFNAEKESGLKVEEGNPLFSKAVRFGQFYYVDKFILLTSGDSFFMYKYHLDTTKSDIKRYRTNNRYKLVKQFQMTDAQSITAFQAINTFHSYITMCAGSDKSVEIFDMNVSHSVKVIKDVHTRPVHCIALNQGSHYSSIPSSAYDLFVTAAASDCIKLWDLRTCRCVRRFEGHMNRSLPCGVAFSPCSRFIATGSEDRAAYIFDMRSGTYLHKLTGHTESVCDVTFHPARPMIITASLDGKLRTFVP